ncbi:MAG: YcnI family protein [Burkholderiales bacterium]|nr:YcnI family protein [Burkholderiales bacterium]
MPSHTTLKGTAASILLAVAGASSAHIVLQDGAAAAATSYRATLRVGHGCEGTATTALSVTIPEGFTGAQPMPKPGWNVSTRSGTLTKPYVSHGKTYTEGVLEITWTAKSPEYYLPEAYYDEFVLRGTTPAAPGALWFKVVQTCEKGSNPWTDVPANGTSTKGMKFPAALLEVLDIQAAGGHNH